MKHRWRHLWMTLYLLSIFCNFGSRTFPFSGNNNIWRRIRKIRTNHKYLTDLEIILTTACATYTLIYFGFRLTYFSVEITFHNYKLTRHFLNDVWRQWRHLLKSPITRWWLVQLCSLKILLLNICNLYQLLCFDFCLNVFNKLRHNMQNVFFLGW